MAYFELFLLQAISPSWLLSYKELAIVKNLESKQLR